MTSRRATGTRVRQLRAGSRRSAGPAFLSAARVTALATFALLGVAALHAATHVTHAHRTASVQSSGKASAHVLHETAARSSHAVAKASPRHGASSAHARAKPSRATGDSAHTKGKQSAGSLKADGRHKHRQEPLVDEPLPVFRARNENHPRRAHAEPAADRHGRGTYSGSRRDRSQPATARRTIPATHDAIAAAILAGSTHLPSTLPRRSADALDQDPRGSLPGLTPATTLSAPSSQPSSPASAVTGFGAEVDLLSPPLSARATIAAPQGSPAEQQRQLREAAEIASQPMFVPLYTREGKLLIPPPLRGSHDILVHQNQMADDAGLSRIQDDADLARMRRAHLLVDLEESSSLRINEGLPMNRRSARPWAAAFANDIARAFYARFGDALQLNSAVRTVAYQLRLQRVNGNAAATGGEGASPHLTGQAIDFGKRGMSAAEIAWMRSYLVPLIDAGKIDVEEEFQQACFHISVYAGYQPAPVHRAPVRTEVAQIGKATRRGEAATVPPSENDPLP